MPRLNKITTWLKKNRLIARLDWKLYLLRDFWGSKVWKRTKESMTPFHFKLATGLHPAYSLMSKGEFEPYETRLFVSLLESSDVFIDVGANLGYYCCFAMQRNKAVLAFEPQYQNLALLYRNMAINGWKKGIEIFPMALSAEPGLLALFGASGPSASLVKDWAGYSPLFSSIVPTNTLDNILGERFSGRQLIVKIDVEGAEFQVLRGARATLSRKPSPIWLIEICLDEFHPGGSNPDYLKTFQTFWDKGYACYCADEHCTPVTPADVYSWQAGAPRVANAFNYIFVEQHAIAPSLMPADKLRYGQ